MNYRPVDAGDLPDIDKPAQRILVLLQFVIGQFAKPEVFPPGRLLLAPVPLQHLREETTGPVLLGPFGLVLRERGNETCHHGTHFLQPGG